MGRNRGQSICRCATSRAVLDKKRERDDPLNGDSIVLVYFGDNFHFMDQCKKSTFLR